MKLLMRRVWAASTSILGVAAASCVGCAEADGARSSGPPRDDERMRETIDEIRARFAAVEHLDTEVLREKLRDDSVLLVDVRRPDEFEVSHLPGAIHLDVASPDEVFLRALPEDREVVVYCSVGYRSAMVAERLRAAGRVNVHNYVGSIFAWANAGLPLRRGVGSPAETVHPYSADWGALLEPALRHPID